MVGSSECVLLVGSFVVILPSFLCVYFQCTLQLRARIIRWDVQWSPLHAHQMSCVPNVLVITSAVIKKKIWQIQVGSPCCYNTSKCPQGTKLT